MEKTRRCLVGGPSPGTYRAGGDKPLDVTGHGWPSKPLVEEMKGAGNPWMARQLGRVGRLQQMSDLRDKDDVW